MINSRDLNDLEPSFKNLVERWLQGCADIGIDILVVCTYRDNEYQDYLYQYGRTREGAIKTNARGGQSKHNVRKAVDFCVMRGKKCDWDNVADFTRAGMLAEHLGLVWAGRWNGKLKELGHIEAY